MLKRALTSLLLLAAPVLATPAILCDGAPAECCAGPGCGADEAPAAADRAPHAGADWTAPPCCSVGADRGQTAAVPGAAPASGDRTAERLLLSVAEQSRVAAGHGPRVVPRTPIYIAHGSLLI